MADVQIKVDKSSITWNPEIIDKLLAPEISKFTSASIRSLELDHPESPHWIQNLFLNTVFISGYEEGVRPIVVQYLRRASSSFNLYHEAKKETEAYLVDLNPLKPKSKQYYKAIDLWEGFVLQMQILIDANNKINKYNGSSVNVFEKGDGSKEQRIYEIGNCIKHFSGSTPDEQKSGDFWSPLWLTNNGIQSLKHALTFEEAGAILHEASIIATQYASRKNRKDKEVLTIKHGASPYNKAFELSARGRHVFRLRESRAGVPTLRPRSKCRVG